MDHSRDGDNPLIAVLEMMKSSYWYSREVQLVLRPFDISHEQFNILRILEHNQSRPFSLKEIQSRVMNRTANTTRLVEKLKLKKLIKSQYSRTNRRMLEIQITDKGLSLLKQIQQPLSELGNRVEKKLSKEESEEMIRSLRKLRTA